MYVLHCPPHKLERQISYQEQYMNFILKLNQILWSGPVLVLLMGLHLYHTCRLRFVQRHIIKGIRLSIGDDPSSSPHAFSRFGSLTTTLAATLGTGNIVGVSTAVFLGGPGAVFWCWLTGVFGMATTYAETYLCSKYRYPDCHGKPQSGPMYLLRYLLHHRGLGFLYAAALCLSAFFIGCTTQSNAITEACLQIFGVSTPVSAILTAFVVGLILLQGRQWIEKFSMAVVPTMAIFFLGGCVLYLILHREYIPSALSHIFSGAFGLRPMGGGLAGFTLGKAVRYGVARGLFTNEAGLGTAGLVAGSSSESQAKNQALISMSASFWDTVVLCAITGIVLVAFQLEYPGEWMNLSAGSLTAAAFGKLPFFGEEILAVAIISFALATLVGWSFFGRQGFDYLFHGHGTKLYLTFYILMIFIGGIMPLTLVWELTDLINLFLLLPSVYLLLRCRSMLHS